MSSPPQSEDQVTVIEPRRGWGALNLGEVWRERGLLYFFIWRDLKVKYRQTLLGFTWALINPIVNTGIFTIIFGGVAKLPTQGLPAPIFYIIGLTIWRYFAATLAAVSASLVGNASVVTKIYFPRLLLPLNACVTGLVEYGIALLLVVACMLAVPGPAGSRGGTAEAVAPGDMIRVDEQRQAVAGSYKVTPQGKIELPNGSAVNVAGMTGAEAALAVRQTIDAMPQDGTVEIAVEGEKRALAYRPAWTMVFLPALVALTMLTALGVGLFFAALNVRYRDVGQFVPFLTQIWMYLTIILPFSALPERWGVWRYVYALNPMVGVVEGARWLIAHPYMEGAQPPVTLILLGMPFIAVSLLLGLRFFKKTEQLFADIV